MFDLTDAGRANLEAVLDEFQRASRYYPPLYHKRLIPWSEESMEVYIRRSQWEAFIQAESAKPNDEEWWQWDGPHSAYPGFGSVCLGMWSGHPDGLQEFTDLVESALCVLRREDFLNEATDEDYYLQVPFAFGSSTEWLNTLHAWAFRFQMPLLKCDMTLWEAEDSDPSDFFELAEQFGQMDGVSYPLHPVCWTLIHNVFTSSMTAIRAILEPHNVITTNEPWQNGTVEDEGDGEPVPCHCLLETPMGWTIRLLGSETPIFSKQQAGLHRIAVLIERSPNKVSARDLAQYGGRRIRRRGKVFGAEVLDEKGLGERKSLRLAKAQEVDDEEGRNELGEELRELINEREAAENDNDLGRLDAAQKDIEMFKKTHHIASDGSIKKPRPFRDTQQKKAYGNVSASIKNAIEDIKQRSSEVGRELGDQVKLPALKFEPNKHYTSWKVRRMK